MIVRHRAAIVLLVLSVGLVLSGCAIINREHAIQPPASWPIATTVDTLSIFLDVNATEDSETQYFCVSVWSYRDKHMPYFEETVGRIAKVYRDSGLVSHVNFSGSGAASIPGHQIDLTARVHLQLQPTVLLPLLAVLNALTLTIIPSFCTLDFTMTTDIVNKEHQVVGTFEVREKITLWMQLFLMFLAPSYGLEASVNGLLDDSIRATLSQAYKKGVFQKRRFPTH